MPGTKRVINIGTNPDDGTGDLLRDALNKVNLNFDDVWEYTSVNSNLNITGDSINGTTDVIINPADSGAFKVTGDTIINPNGGNYNFTINGDLHNNVLYVQASTGRIGVHNTSPTVTLDITGDTKVSGMTTANNLTVTGNTILGDTNTDTVTYNAKAASDFLPFSTTQNIGAPSNRWGYIYTTNLDVSGTIAGTFTGSMTSTLTGDVNNTNVTTVNLNSTGPSNLTDVNISGNLVVQGTTTTLETSQVLVDNSIVFEGATDDAFETTLAITDPTADRTFTFPDATGIVATQQWVNSQSFATGSGPTDTDALTEGTTNLYFTNARADARITAAGSANWNTAYGWGDHGTAGYLTSVPAQTFSSLTGKPTTIAGYGITDAVVDFADLGNKPTTIAGYGITDAVVDFADLGNKPTTIAGYGITDAVTDFADLGNKPTTIAGYGITDAFDGTFSALSGKPTTIAGYGITDVNTSIDSHLNQSNPTSGYVLSWNGSDYAWVANGSGGSGISNVVEDTTPQLGGNLDAQAFDITTTGKILYANVYDTTGDLPSASTYHGMFAHVHGTGKGYFAHAGNWIALAKESELSSYQTTAGLNAAIDSHLNQSGPTSGYVLSWNGTDYAWVANSSSSTFGIAGNTGTHTFDPATETLTFLGTTGQINAGIAANNVTLSLDSDINSITSISFEGTTADANETKLQAVDPTADNTINLPDASGTVMLNVVEDTTPQLGGNLDTQSFTVDGRDVSVDGTKLDGIATGATSNPYVFTSVQADDSLSATADNATDTLEIKGHSDNNRIDTTFGGGNDIRIRYKSDELKAGTSGSPTSSNVSWDFALYDLVNIDFNADIDLNVSNVYMGRFHGIGWNRDSSSHTITVKNGGTTVTTLTIPANSARGFNITTFSTVTAIELVVLN